MKVSKITLISGVFVACVAMFANTQAQDGCAQIDQIIKSGLDRQNPFSAVAGLNLPNADCDIDVGRDVELNYYWCEWNSDNYSKLDELFDEEHELFMDYTRHEGGYEAWDEAEELIEKANYWIRTWNYGIKQFPQPSQAQLAIMLEWKSKAENFERQAHRAEQRALELDREKEELEAKYEAKEREYVDFENELEQMEEREVDNLYTGLYKCFDSGAIGDSAISIDVENKEWTLESGCSVRIRTKGPVLYIHCPNPDYQG